MTYRIFPLILALFLALTPPFAIAQSATDSASAPQASQTEAQKKDGEIIEILNTLNQGEIAAAHLALKRSDNPDVKKFADEMINDHGKSLEDTKKLAQKINIIPVVSEKSHEMQKKNAKLFKKLAAEPKGKFDDAYIGAMVKGHEKALAALQDKLIPKASNPELKAALQATAGVVEHHLAMAKQTQQELSAH